MIILLLVLFSVLVIIFAVFSRADRAVFFQKTKTFEHDGITRTYRLYEHKVTNNPKVIIALHHLGGNGLQLAYVTGLQNEIPDNTVLVYPDAIAPQHEGERKGWNADFCCGSGWKNNVDDIGFISSLIDELTSKYKTKDNKVFIAGFSNGAIFAHKLSSEIPEKIAGFAAAAGSIGTMKNQHTPTKPVPALLIHGAQDKTIYIDGGATADEPDFGWRSFSDTAQAWRQINECSGESMKDTETQSVKTYEKCTAPLQVVINNAERHQWPDWRLFNIWHRHSDGSKQILDFFNSL